MRCGLSDRRPAVEKVHTTSWSFVLLVGQSKLDQHLSATDYRCSRADV